MSDRVAKLMLPPDDPDDVYPAVYSMSDGDDGGEGGGEAYDPTGGDEGAEESEPADEVVEADGEAGVDGTVDADGAAGGGSAMVDAWRGVDGDDGGDAI